MPVYRVQFGDILDSIAKCCGTIVQALVQENRIPNTDRISVGQKLHVPQWQEV